jgi:hypothetical protein
MARFGFAIPGRKKAPPPPITVTEPMTKAHKILGSVPLNLDSSKSWDSGSNADAQITGSSSQSHVDSSSRQPTVGTLTPASSAEPWADESDILPPSFKLNGQGGDDAFTETSTALRSHQSSSTLKSWYDKSKMPLAVSQQTSASAMAKGLPPKAQRMLDMENLHPVSKPKKSNKLGFSALLSGGRSPKRNNEPVLGPEYMTSSPSLLLSPPDSNSGRRRHILNKRPTKESLREAAEPGRPSTSGSASHNGRDGHMKGLADLYEHYEQMSFRQVLDSDLDDGDDEDADGLGIQEADDQSIVSPRTPLTTDLQLEKMLQQAHVTALAASKTEPQFLVPEDGASISSRHTRTSRASIITRSIQETDLQETSVLMLSSDSEDDSYDEPETRSQTSASTRPMSTFKLLELDFASSPRSTSTGKRASKSSKRTSFARDVTYLGVPNGHANSHDSQMTITPEANASSPSKRGSIISSSSAGSGSNWRTRSDQGDDTYVVALLPTSSRSRENLHEDADQTTTEFSLESMTARADQPTPPLSPSSVDFYIRSAHTSMEASAGHNRFMAVTRQEEMLLSALRHKRQIMRESVSSNQPLALDEPESPPRHHSKASDVTVTSLLDFDFPLPPTHDATPRRGTLGQQCQPQGLHAVLDSLDDKDDEMESIMAPAPLNPRQSQMVLKNTRYQPPEVQKKPQAEVWYEPHHDIDTEGLDDLLRGIESTNSPSPPRRRGSRRSSVSSTSSAGSRYDLRGPRLNLAPKMDPVMESDDSMDEAAGIPRPDSPISPSEFPMPPTMAPLNRKMARLSAVGGVRMGELPDWFKANER